MRQQARGQIIPGSSRHSLRRAVAPSLPCIDASQWEVSSCPCLALHHLHTRMHIPQWDHLHLLSLCRYRDNLTSLQRLVLFLFEDDDMGEPASRVAGSTPGFRASSASCVRAGSMCML